MPGDPPAASGTRAGAGGRGAPLLTVVAGVAPLLGHGRVRGPWAPSSPGLRAESPRSARLLYRAPAPGPALLGQRGWGRGAKVDWGGIWEAGWGKPMNSESWTAVGQGGGGRKEGPPAQPTAPHPSPGTWARCSPSLPPPPSRAAVLRGAPPTCTSAGDSGPILPPSLLPSSRPFGAVPAGDPGGSSALQPGGVAASPRGLLPAQAACLSARGPGRSGDWIPRQRSGYGSWKEHVCLPDPCLTPLQAACKILGARGWGARGREGQ